MDLRSDHSKRVLKNKQIENVAEQRFSGDWFKKYQTGLDKAEDADDFSASRKSGRMLDDFINEREGAATDEEDDDDIYERYRETANRS